MSTVWLGSSVVKVLARFARGPGFESRSGRVLFPPLWHLVASVGVCARAASSKGTVSSVPAWFRADSGTNLIKQGEIVTGRPCGSVAQWSEFSHGMREVLGSSPGRAVCFFLPCDTCMQIGFDGQKHIFWQFLLWLRAHISPGLNIRDALLQNNVIMATYCMFYFLQW